MKDLGSLVAPSGQRPRGKALSMTSRDAAAEGTSLETRDPSFAEAPLDDIAGEPSAASGKPAAAFDEPDAVFDMPDAVVGRPDTASGMPDAASGLPDAAFGLPDAASGRPDAEN